MYLFKLKKMLKKQELAVLNKILHFKKMRATRSSMPKKVVKLDKPESQKKPQVNHDSSNDDEQPKRSTKKSIINNHN